MKYWLFILLVWVCLTPETLSAQKKYQPTWESIDSRPIPKWWEDDKFGIFIHWGAYSVPGWCSKGNYAEWYQYGLMNGDTARQAFHRQKFGKDYSYYGFADEFKAELYNPDEWAKLFERAGAKYVVLTSKHHDGYCLWPSKEANKTWGFPWNSVDRGPKRDLLGDLFVALRKTSVKPGMYYSLYEWFNPLWKADQRRFAVEHMQPQVYDLISKYKPFVFWTDGDWDAPAETWGSQELIQWMYNESPVKDSLVINDRWGSGIRFNHGGHYTPEYQPDLDFPDHAWEESRGMGYSYGYNRMEDAWDYNSAQTLILSLVDKVSRGGNFLLDIGPDEHGKIPPIMQDRLLEMGKWLSINGEAIYGTRRWRSPHQWSEGRRDYKPQKDHNIDDWKTGGDLMLKLTVDPDPGYAVQEVFYTYKPQDNTLYAIFPKWRDDKQLILNDLSFGKDVKVTLLDTQEALKWSNTGANATIILPEFNPNRIKSNHAFVVKISNFGAFCPNPTINLVYDFKTLQPTARINIPQKKLEQNKGAGYVIRYTTDGTDVNESSSVYSQPIAVQSGRKVQARVFRTGFLPSSSVSAVTANYPLMPALQFRRKLEGGLTMQLMQAEKWDLQSVLKGKETRSALVKSLVMDPYCEKSPCGQVWTGYLNIKETGGYQFATESDDGSVLYIDNQKIVDNDGLHGMEKKQGIAHLEKGWHSFKMVYFNAGGGAGFNVSFGRVGESLGAFPVEMIFH